MADTSHYDTAKALMASVTARAKAVAKSRGQQADLLLRQFEFSRLLARVFASESAEHWVLKGGIAQLTRIPGGRMTRDVDLFHRTRQVDLDQAVAEFESAMAIDLGDHFTFQVVEVQVIPEKSGRVGAARQGAGRHREISQAESEHSHRHRCRLGHDRYTGRRAVRVRVGPRDRTAHSQALSGG